MTAATKNNTSTSSSPGPDRAEGPAAEDNNAPAGSASTLEELARAQDELTHELHLLVAGQALDEAPGDADRSYERAGRMVTVARSQLLGQLREQEQEQARRQLAAATQSTEDAAASVVRGVTTIIRSVLPAALLRPDDLIEAAYILADQGLRVGRRIALTISSSARELTASL